MNLSRIHTAHDIVRHRPTSLCRPTSCVKASSAVVRCRVRSVIVIYGRAYATALRLSVVCLWRMYCG